MPHVQALVIFLLQSFSLLLLSSNFRDAIFVSNQILLCLTGMLFMLFRNVLTGMLFGSLCEGRASFCTGLIYGKLCRFLLMFLTGFKVSYSFFLS